jgi:glutamate receptor, ionotropic, invertebrate
MFIRIATHWLEPWQTLSQITLGKVTLSFMRVMKVHHHLKMDQVSVIRNYTFSGLMRLKDILQIHKPSNDPITVRQLGNGPDYRPLLKEIQASGESHIILDVSNDKVLDLLRQAESVKMLEEYQRYILTSLDTHTLDFEELKNTRSNITSVRIMDTKTFEITTAVYDWVQGEQNQNRMFRVSPENVKVYG